MNGRADNRNADLAALRDPDARAAFLAGLHAKYGPAAREHLAAGFRKMLTFEDFMEQLHALGPTERRELLEAYHAFAPLDHLIRRAMEALVQKRVDLNYDDEVFRRHYGGAD